MSNYYVRYEATGAKNVPWLATIYHKGSKEIAGWSDGKTLKICKERVKQFLKELNNA
jgi:hypothetical protein